MTFTKDDWFIARRDRADLIAIRYVEILKAEKNVSIAGPVDSRPAQLVRAVLYFLILPERRRYRALIEAVQAIGQDVIDDVEEEKKI